MCGWEHTGGLSVLPGTGLFRATCRTQVLVSRPARGLPTAQEIGSGNRWGLIDYFNPPQAPVMGNGYYCYPCFTAEEI